MIIKTLQVCDEIAGIALKPLGYTLKIIKKGGKIVGQYVTKEGKLLFEVIEDRLKARGKIIGSDDILDIDIPKNDIKPMSSGSDGKVILEAQDGTKWELMVKEIRQSLDDILEVAKHFDDNILDIVDAGLKNWKTFQKRVDAQLRIIYPNSKIGNQIYLDVTYINIEGMTVTKTIIPDNLVQKEINSIKKYKVVDAKTSINDDLVNMQDLTSKCTPNQKEIYPLIDDLASNKILKVEMYGENAKSAFQTEFPVNASKIEIQLESSVEFWVNSDKNDFDKYIIRSRIK